MRSSEIRGADGNVERAANGRTAQLQQVLSLVRPKHRMPSDLENVSEQSLAYEPREFQLGRAGIAGATVAVRGLSMRARFFFSRRSRSRINRRAAELSRNRAASPPKARSHHSIDEFVRGGCNPRIYGADQFPEALPVPLRQHTGARFAVAQH